MSFGKDITYIVLQAAGHGVTRTVLPQSTSLKDSSSRERELRLPSIVTISFQRSYTLAVLSLLASHEYY